MLVDLAGGVCNRKQRGLLKNCAESQKAPNRQWYKVRSLKVHAGGNRAQSSTNRGRPWGTGNVLSEFPTLQRPWCVRLGWCPWLSGHLAH